VSDQKTALVTGSSSGIGLAIAKALLGRGWAVALNGRDERKLRQVDRGLRAAGGRTVALPGDVSRPAEARDVVGAAVKELGGLDLLVNNAGIGRWASVGEMSLEEWEEVLAVDLTGVFLVTREALPSLRPRKGYVINIASVAGKQGFAEASAYCAAKHGLMGFTEALLKEEVGSGVRVSALCPGYVATPMVLDTAGVPAGEMIQPEDVAATVLWLLDLSPNVVVREVVLERTGSF
jgi:NAD(P)-dependent dehydrogenase (short-subunit alcohol dehydrogenase family)